MGHRPSPLPVSRESVPVSAEPADGPDRHGGVIVVGITLMAIVGFLMVSGHVIARGFGL